MNPVVVAAQDGFPTRAEMTSRIIDKYQAAPYRTPISYAELETLLERNVQTDRRARAAVLIAGKELLRSHRRLLLNEVRAGYRIAHPSEHADYSKNKRAAAGRRLTAALLSVVNVAYEMLSDTEQDRLRMEGQRVVISRTFLRKIGRMKQLPTKEQMALPTGRQLRRLITKKA